MARSSARVAMGIVGALTVAALFSGIADGGSGGHRPFVTIDIRSNFEVGGEVRFMVSVYNPTNEEFRFETVSCTAFLRVWKASQLVYDSAAEAACPQVITPFVVAPQASVVVAQVTWTPVESGLYTVIGGPNTMPQELRGELGFTIFESTLPPSSSARNPLPMAPWAIVVAIAAVAGTALAGLALLLRRRRHPA